LSDIDFPLLRSVLEEVMPGLDARAAKQLAKAVAIQIERDRKFGLTELADRIDEQSPQSVHEFSVAAKSALQEIDVTLPP
jgi:hypothetical protein